MKTKPTQGEPIIMDGCANLQKTIEAVDNG